MKNPTKVGTVIKGRVYTVPTFTNLYGQKVNGSNATLKMYDSTITVDNHGMKPVSLLKVISLHFIEQGNLTLKETEALHHIQKAYRILNSKS